jgi:hypothetical protein
MLGRSTPSSRITPLLSLGLVLATGYALGRIISKH